MKKLCCILASDDRLDFALANTIIGLKKHCHMNLDKIFVFHNINSVLRNKIKMLWPEKISFIYYSQQRFQKDLGMEVNFKQNRFPHLIYSKFYIFSFVKNFDFVCWIDIDVLIQNDFSSLLNDDYDIMWRKGAIPPLAKFFDKIKQPYKHDEICKPNGGFILVNSKNMMKKVSSRYLTKECFSILKTILGEESNETKSVNDIACTDEIPFGVLHKKYALTWKDSRPVANAMPMEVNEETSIIHAPSIHKFWTSSINFFLFPEWKYNQLLWSSLEPNANEKLSLDKRYTTQGDICKDLHIMHIFFHIISSVNIANMLKFYEKKLCIARVSAFELEIGIMYSSEFYYYINLYDCSPWHNMWSISINCRNKKFKNYLKMLEECVKDVQYRECGDMFLLEVRASGEDVTRKYENLVQSTFDFILHIENSSYVLTSHHGWILAFDIKQMCFKSKMMSDEQLIPCYTMLYSMNILCLFVFCKGKNIIYILTIMAEFVWKNILK